MKKSMLALFGLFVMFFLSGCGSMQGAFKAGIIFFIAAISIVALFAWLLRLAVKWISSMSFFFEE